MEIDLFEIFGWGVDYGQLIMERDFFEHNWADAVGGYVASKKCSMPSQIIQRQPHSEEWLAAKRKAYPAFIELIAKVKSGNEIVFIK